MMIFQGIKPLLSTLCLLLFVVANSQAEERITAFDSRIVINSDSSLDVTESISVIAQGREIKRGIYRDFPTRYKDRHGNYHNVDFELLSVLRNGQPEDYHTKAMNNGIRIYIGNKNRFIEQGSHTFTLQYYTSRQLGFFEDYDELYWNVTGNGWVFPIEQSRAEIILPRGVTTYDIDTEAYTGAAGAKDKNYTVSNIDTDAVLFTTSSLLPAGHGLSIVVNWPKGFVKEPSQEERISWFMADNRSLIIGLCGLLIIWLYLYIAWLKVGKDPVKGSIYPRYKPDKEHSPASMRFVQRMGYDKKTFAAALVNMAVKGYLTISESNSHFTLKKTGSVVPLSRGEAAIVKKLFNTKDSIVLKQSEHGRIGKAVDDHKKVLKRDYEKIYFLSNRAILFPAWFASIVLLAVVVLTIESKEAQEVVAFFSLWLTIWTVGVTMLVMMVYHAWRNVSGFLSLIPALSLSAFATPFIAGEGFGLYTMWQNAGTAVLAIFVLVIITNLLFYQWMKAPTFKGRKLLDRIDGFKLYLSVAEAEEIRLKHPPESTPELFERYLPYAMALDVEHQWSERFSSVFAQLESHYTPLWYSGSHWHEHDPAGFSSAMGSSLSSAIASSSTAPGSSSGSGGGGSSGGGGGGGGGGGW